MRKSVFCSATALILIASSLAVAQQPTATQAQQQSFPAQPQTTGQTKAPDHTVPPPPEAQPQAPLADQAKPAAVGPAQANTAASAPSTNNGPPGATPETMPSTISAENAKRDKLPTTALQFPLSDEQKTLITKSTADAPTAQGKGDLSNVHVADFLPTDTPTRDFTLEIMREIPSAKAYKFVKLDKRLLIVDAANLTVVGELTQ